MKLYLKDNPLLTTNIIPDEYQLVEYINYASINTGIISGYGISCKMDLKTNNGEFTGWNYWISAGNEGNWYIAGVENGKYHMYVDNTIVRTEIDAAKNTRMLIEMDFSGTTKKFIINGTVVASVSSASQASFGSAIKICDGQNTYYFRTQIMGQQGQMLRDYYPCYRKSDNKPGMYDRIAGTFNASTDSNTICGPELSNHISSAAKVAITDLFIKGCPAANKFGLLKAILTTNGNALKYISLALGNVTGGTQADIDMLYALTGKNLLDVNNYGRVLYNNGEFSHTIEQFPDITGTLTVAAARTSYATKIAEILQKLGLTINVTTNYIDFQDSNVETVLKNHSVGDGTGITSAQLAALTSIGSWFFNNTSITEFPELANSGVTSLAENAFYGCTSLVNLGVPSGITSIARGAFTGCHIVFEDINWPNLTVFGDYYQRPSFETCTVKKITSLGSITTVDGFANQSQLTSVILPNTLTNLAAGAFYNCPNLESINLPSSITTIGRNAMERCPKLRLDLNLPNISTWGDAYEHRPFNQTPIVKITALGLSSIPSSSFSYQTMLSEVHLTNTQLSSIEDSAFSGCSALKSFTLLVTTPPTLGNDVFTNTPIASLASDAHIYVPAESVSAYQAASGWSAYASIISAIPE